MADDQPHSQAPPGQGVTEVVNQLTNIARQLSVWSQSITNSTPAATTTTSPKFTGVTLGTAAVATVVVASTTRHGLVLHNVGNTANVYIFQAGMTTPPTTAALAGAMIIYPGGTLSMPSTAFPNCNAGFNGFTNTGSSQPFTVVEFY